LEKIRGYNKNSCIGTSRKKKKVQKRIWFNDKCQSVIEERDIARALMLKKKHRKQ